MQRLLVAALTVSFFCSAVFAKAKHAPIPEELLDAKTIYLLNRTGKQSILDSAYSEFQKWGRLTVSGNKDSADLVAVFSRAGGGDYDAAQGVTRMEVFLKGATDAGDVAYETTEEVTQGSGIIYKHLIRDESAKRCVDNFMKRLSAK